MNGCEQGQRVHHGPHVGRGLEDHAVDQTEGQFDALVDPAFAVGEEGQTLRAGRQIVLEHRPDLFQLALKDVLLLLGGASLCRDARELAVEKRGSKLPPIIQPTGGKGDGEERRREAPEPPPSP